MNLLDLVKTNDELRDYLDSLTKHVLEADKRMCALEAKLNILENGVTVIEDEVQEILDKSLRYEEGIDEVLRKG